MRRCIALTLLASALHPISSQPVPWEVQFLGLSADFGANSDDQEVVLAYSIGKDRNYQTNILATDCESAVTGANITLNDTKTNIDASTDALSLAYDIDKATIATSNIWNATASQIEFCQVVQLTIPAVGNSPLLVIVEDVRRFDIDLDLSVEFDLGNKPLGEGPIENETGSANVTGTVEGCKCGGMDNFTCNTDPLVANTELFVCIKSTSNDVEVDFLDSMLISQGATSLPVVENDTISFPSITSRQYVPAENGVAVSTRVPANLFDYSDGASISITGVIDMKLFGSGSGSRRRLRISIVDDEKVGGEIESPFELEVALQKGSVYVEEEDHATSSATSIASRSLAALGVILAAIAL